MPARDVALFGRLDSTGRIAPSRHDLLLAVIPLAFALAMVVAIAFGVTTRVALAGASVVGTAALVDALFLNPPTRGARPS